MVTPMFVFAASVNRTHLSHKTIVVYYTHGLRGSPGRVTLKDISSFFQNFSNSCYLASVLLLSSNQLIVPYRRLAKSI